MEKNKETIVSVVVIGVMLILGVLIVMMNWSEVKELERIGLILCSKNGYEYWDSSGSTIRCYTEDNETAIRELHEFWIDKESAKEIYLGESQ